MLFAAILPIISAIVMSFTRFADAGATVMPCDEANTNTTFTITDFTGGISRYTGGESFTFYLSTDFNDYSTGCSGSINKGAPDNGLEWCSARVPGWNASIHMTNGHQVSVGHDFLCRQSNGAVVTAHADGSAHLGVRAGMNGRLSMKPTIMTFPATIKFL